MKSICFFSCCLLLLVIVACVEQSIIEQETALTASDDRTARLGNVSSTPEEQLVGSSEEIVSPKMTLNVSSGLGRIKICSLQGGKVESFLTYNKSTGEVLSVESKNDQERRSSVSVRNNGTGKVQKQIVMEMSTKETSLSLSSENKIFINTQVLNDFGFLVGVEIECRYPE